MQNLITRLNTHRFSEVKTQNGLFLLSLLFIIGLLFSRALLSVAPVAMLVWALWQMPLAQSLKKLGRNIPALCLLGFYALFLLSTLYTQDWEQWRYYAAQYLPLITVPLAWGLLPRLRRKQQYGLLFIFILLVTVLAVSTVINYFLHFEEINTMIYHSQNPTSINGLSHIYFSILMALAVFYGIYIYRWPAIYHPKIEENTLLVCVGLTFISLHIMAFRTGLLALYIAMFVQFMAIILRQKKYVLGAGLLVTMVAMLMGAYFLLESLQLRAENTRRDIERYWQHQDINYYSVSQRLAAWETALAVVKHNWLLGVAPADVKAEMKRQYAIKDFGLKQENQVMVHNQYLHLLLSLGVAGLILLLYTLIYPFIKFIGPHNPEGGAFLIIMATAMLVESIFQRQLGLNTFVFFYCLFFSNKVQEGNDNR